MEERTNALGDTRPTFEAVWRAYDYAKGKKEARAAWAALPAEVDRTAVIKAAGAWQASWDAQGKPDAPRKHLATWLREERYDEDPPRGFKKVERAKTKTKAGPTTSTTAKPAKRAIRTTATTARITSVDVVKTECATELRLEFTDGDGAVWDYIIPLEHNVQEKQENGQRLFTRLGRATGLEPIDDFAELLGRTVILTGDDAAFAAPTTRPDDEPPLPVKPEPERLANPAPTTMPNESPRDFAARMATSLGAGWPAWMGAEYEYEEDDEAA
ncbi:hypothetical protein [Bradyrhizobium sp. BWC-3-1]|uniref:hypothetical protein n=1 Tax=Bradyrhizobium sp. BWC-3-1 TaxID=3080012 RepID=UPI00293E48C9|nr:hypothetical protein [Bradyrhizobium sp. BWC-3-1]WOH55371.1 hypothetical protein RX329_24010 [Bradyrhizobium sp. BWC-3-1]